VHDLRVILAVFKTPLQVAMLDGEMNIPADTVDVLFGHVEALVGQTSNS